MQCSLLCIALGIFRGVHGGTLRKATLSGQGLISFDAFLQLYSRNYAAGSAEYNERRGLYESRLAAAVKHNAQTGKRWTAAVNDLWDWTDAEMKTLRGWSGGARPQKGALALAHHHGSLRNGTTKAVNATMNATFNDPLPSTKSWESLTTISGKTHNQGGCGSCWAVAAAQTLSAHHEIHRGQVRRFSVQEILACTPNPKRCGGDGYCKGATVELAMDWVMTNGCATEDEKPYKSVRGDEPTCEGSNGGMVPFRILWAAGAKAPAKAKYTGGAEFGMQGWERLPENKYEPVMRALAERGPVAVSVSAEGWFNYGSGIFDGCVKDAIVDHAVVLIGYGQEGSDKYWTIQNSWGSKWGDAGKMRMLRRADEGSWCGIDRQPELGSGCVGGPPQVTVCGNCGILYDTVIPHFVTSL